MRIISWNCNMAFRTKLNLMLDLHPDILVISECEHPDKIKTLRTDFTPTDALWYGTNQHKGLGIFSFNDFRLTPHLNHNDTLRLIIPVAVTNGNFDFNLFAIWAFNPTDKDGVYVEQVWKAVHYYELLMTNSKTILTGDFNSNTIWDRKNREISHSSLVKLLEAKGIHSAYHSHFNQVQGTELHPTFYLYRHHDKPYHLDYCFVSDDFKNRISSVSIGDFKTWCTYSDHVPVIVDFHAQ